MFRRGKFASSDWRPGCARVIGAVDISAGGIWIAIIQQALGASQLVVAAPVVFCSAVGTSLGLLVFLGSGQLVALTGPYMLDIRCCCK